MKGHKGANLFPQGNLSKLWHTGINRQWNRVISLDKPKVLREHSWDPQVGLSGQQGSHIDQA